MWAYPIKLSKDSNRTWLATSRDFPEVTTFGKDVQDTLRHARDAIEEAIAARIAHREPIPDPSSGRYRVRLPAQTVAKILVYRLMQDKGVSKNQLARTLRWHRPQVDRLLNLNHGTRLDAVETALAALGATLTVSIETPRGLDRAKRQRP
jgi:antitoxin HicB